MDLLAVLVQEHFAFVLWVSRVTNNIDVAVVGEFTLALASDLLVAFDTAVPQFVVCGTDRALLTFSGGAVVDQPTTRTLEGVVVELCPGERLVLGSWQETDDCVTVARSVKCGLPESFVATAVCIGGLLKFLLEEIKVALGLALKFCEIRHGCFGCWMWLV